MQSDRANSRPIRRRIRLPAYVPHPRRPALIANQGVERLPEHRDEIAVEHELGGIAPTTPIAAPVVALDQRQLAFARSFMRLLLGHPLAAVLPAASISAAH